MPNNGVSESVRTEFYPREYISVLVLITRHTSARKVIPCRVLMVQERKRKGKHPETAGTQKKEEKWNLFTMSFRRVFKYMRA